MSSFAGRRPLRPRQRDEAIFSEDDGDVDDENDDDGLLISYEKRHFIMSSVKIIHYNYNYSDAQRLWQALHIALYLK